jgi:hypothetical protein
MTYPAFFRPYQTKKPRQSTRLLRVGLCRHASNKAGALFEVCAAAAHSRNDLNVLFKDIPFARLRLSCIFPAAHVAGKNGFHFISLRETLRGFSLSGLQIKTKTSPINMAFAIL